MSETLCNTAIGCYVGSKLVNHLIYADDICLVSPSRKGMQGLLDICNTYGEMFDVVFNSTKSHAMVVRAAADARLIYPSLFLGEKEIDYTNEVRYLGHIISDDMSDDGDIRRQIRALYARGNMLKRHFYNCSLDVKTIIFRAYGTSMYTAVIWCKYKVTSFTKRIITI